MIGGFSQGGTTSLTYALAHPTTVVATLNLSGFLPSHVRPTSADDDSVPVFWGHGTKDPNIPIALAHRGRARLVEAGVPLLALDYPIGHWIVPEEIHAAVEMVERGGQRAGTPPA